MSAERASAISRLATKELALAYDLHTVYFGDFIVGLRRRWYVVLAGLLVTAGLAVATIRFVPITYTSTTSLLMLPPQSAIGSKGNPYLNLGGLTQAVDVLSARVNAGQSTQELLSAHPGVDTTIGPDSGTAGPILLISSTAESPQESTQVRDRLAAIVPDALVSMQDDIQVRASSRITLSRLASDLKPERDNKNQLRAAIVVIAVGCAGTIVGAGYLDYLIARRRDVVRRHSRLVAKAGSKTNDAVAIAQAGTPASDTTPSDAVDRASTGAATSSSHDGDVPIWPLYDAALASEDPTTALPLSRVNVGPGKAQYDDGLLPALAGAADATK